jgi:hypothetical protein
MKRGIGIETEDRRDILADLKTPERRTDRYIWNALGFCELDAGVGDGKIRIGCRHGQRSSAFYRVGP